ncbi:MAG: hypothetical protein NTX25_11130, partial [Proteobacteria bacterium]|nr:hypothetical protein [Pseudomonadota bacterium]
NDDDDDNDNNSHHGHNNKSYKLVCEGVAFDDSDPFGKRGSFSFEGTKAFKQTSDFVVSNEIQEFNFVNYHLGGACASSIKDFGFGELVVNRLCGRQFRDLAFHTFTEEYNGKIYKGNQSCSLKEKSN